MKWLVLLASVLLYCVAADPSLEAKKTKRQAPHEEESTPAPENTRYGIHECVHDKITDPPSFVSSVKSESRRKRNTVSYEPIRIKFHLVEENISSSVDSYRDALISSLNTAGSYLADAVKVNRLSEPLKLIPPCMSTSSSCGSSCECVEVSATLSCGALVTVPQDHIGTATVCRNSSCVEEGNPASRGVDETDLLVYVTAVDSDLCSYYSSGQTLAYAFHCMLDPELSNRPIVGYINICPTNILNIARTLTPDQVLSEGKRLFVHEILHVMGFSVSLFPYFVDEDGNNQTVWGNETYGGYEYYNQALALPNVVDVARRHFDCSSLEGILFSRFSSHWERGILLPEVMTAFVYPTYSQLSNFTLALLKDSGWYDVDYSVSQSTVDGQAIPFIFGKGLGCSFVRGRCYNPEDNLYSCYHYHFSSSIYSPAFTCSYDGLYKGYCGYVGDYYYGCFYTIPDASQGCANPNVTVYSDYELIGENSLCLMSTAGTSPTYYPQCYQVDPIQDGVNYAYKVTADQDGGDFGETYCTESGKNVSTSSGSHLLCSHHEVVETFYPSDLTDPLPNAVCHESCGSCSRIQDPDFCLSCAYSNLELDGEAPNSCSAWRPQYTVRLVGGIETATTLSGRVEVFDGGYWKTVCNENWNEATAKTVCRQLGYATLSNAYIGQGGAFGAGSGDILDNVHCVNASDSISDCISTSISSEDCDHSKDASVTCSAHILEFSEFIGYPFGPSYSSFPQHCHPPNIVIETPSEVSFSYFGQSYPYMSVSELGYVSMHTEPSTRLYLNRNFPFNGTVYDRIVAAFWNNLCIDFSASVHYLNTTRKGNEDLFRTIDATIASRTSQECANFPFEAQWALIVTWEDITSYYYVNRFNSEPVRNTFQLVLATDGTFSFAIYNYAKDGVNGLDDRYNSRYSVAGYNVGDGERYINLPGSGTSSVWQLDEIEGNTGRGGQWVYRIDDDEGLPCGQCRSDGGITLTPNQIATGGGTPVRVITPGECLRPDDTITCYYGGIAVPGMMVDSVTAICPNSYLPLNGLVSFTINITRQREIWYRWESHVFGHGFLYAHEVDAFDTDEEITEEDYFIYTDKEVIVEWPQDFLTFREPNEYTVDVKLFEINVRPLSFTDRVTLCEGIPNSGRVQLTMPYLESQNGEHVTLVMFQVSVNPSHLDAGLNRVAKWTGVYVFRTGSPNDLYMSCSDWYSKQEKRDLLEEVPACPPTEWRARLPNSGFRKVDYSSRIGRTSYNDLFHIFTHPGAASCYVEIIDRLGPTQECCYDSSGSLLVGAPGGGRVELYNRRLSVEMNILKDFFPYVYCCKGEFPMCDLYYEHRPSDDGSRFVIPIPACIYGDPHIVTSDGYKYTFNGKGEFILIETNDGSFSLQGRMAPANSINNTAVAATVFSALATKSSTSAVVQIELNDTLRLRVDSVEYTFGNMTSLSFTGVEVTKGPNETLSASFTNGVYIEVRAVTGEDVTSWISTIIVRLPDTLQDSTRGLMGSFNADTSDDLVPRSGGDPLALNSSLEDIHWNFGVTWIIDNANDSLFYYGEESFEDIYSPNFNPLFEATFDDPDLQAEAVDICGDDFYCLFDIAVTGDTNLGLTTLEGGQELDMIINASQPVICEPECQNGACIDNNMCRCSEGYAGERCSEQVILPCDSSLCQHGGTCTQFAGTYNCTCRRGYSGTRCENGPNLEDLDEVRDKEFPKTKRDLLERLINIWRAVPTALDTSFLIEELEETEGYSFAVDSGSVIYKFEISYRAGSEEATLKVTEYQ